MAAGMTAKCRLPTKLPHEACHTPLSRFLSEAVTVLGPLPVLRNINLYKIHNEWGAETQHTGSECSATCFRFTSSLIAGPGQPEHPAELPWHRHTMTGSAFETAFWSKWYLLIFLPLPVPLLLLPPSAACSSPSESSEALPLLPFLWDGCEDSIASEALRSRPMFFSFFTFNKFEH